MSNPKYLRLVYNTWYFEMAIPKVVQHHFGQTKFYQTTKFKFEEVKKAEIYGLELARLHRNLIKKVKSLSEDPEYRTGLQLNKLLNEYKNYDSKNPPINFPKEHNFDDFKNQLVESVYEDIDEIKKNSGEEKAQEVSDIAFGTKKYLKNIIEDWATNELERRLKPKTVDSRRSNVELICQSFPTVEYFFKENNVKNWLHSLFKDKGFTPSRIQKVCDSGKSFFNYLVDIEVIKYSSNNPVLNPFVVPKEYRIGKNHDSKSKFIQRPWQPMSVDEVICCYQAAVNKEDSQLSDLIMIGAYTGLRISEICHLEIDDIKLREGFLKVKDSKSESGIREVPINEELKPRIRELIKQSQDGFIISGLTFNKYGKRSDAIGKRFGRLKDSLGFSDRHVFHSTRKTVGTTLENSNVKENIASDILGHKKQHITYKVYSGGANMKIKKESMKGIHYDWNKKVKSPNQIIEEKEKRENVRNAKSKTTKP